MNATARAALGFWVMAGALVLLSTSAHSQNKGDPGEIRGLKLGLQAQSMNTNGFDEFACALRDGLDIGTVAGDANAFQVDLPGDVHLLAAIIACRPEADARPVGRQARTSP